MQFQVPQFIEVEDKIFGPLTTKQFFYVLGGAGIIFLMYLFLEIWLVIVLGLPIIAFAVSLAFLKINGVPFVKVFVNAFGFAVSKRLYLWKKREIEKIVAAPAEKAPKGFIAPTGAKLTKSKLQDLAWSLDIQQELKR